MSGYPCCFPSGGRQFGHAVDRPCAELGEDVIEVGAQIDLQAAAGFDDGSNGGDLGSGLLAANVQPIFPAKYQRPNAAFANVMPRPILCRATELESHFKAVSYG